MLEEKFHQLENKLTSLLTEIKRLREENGNLRELAAASAQEADKLRGEIALQSERAEKQAQELEANVSKEEEVRERLRLIIEKIDAIDQEVENA